MAAYRQVYDSRHLQADCQEPGSAPGPYARKSSMGYLYLFADGPADATAVVAAAAAAAVGLSTQPMLSRLLQQKNIISHTHTTV